MRRTYGIEALLSIEDLTPIPGSFPGAHMSFAFCENKFGPSKKFSGEKRVNLFHLFHLQDSSKIEARYTFD